MTIRIAAGTPGGAYHELAEAFAAAIEDGLPGLRCEVLTTAGAEENLRLLTENRADLGIVQGNTLSGQANTPATIDTLVPK